MKVVKLNKTHKLYRDGYTHALRFDSWGVHCLKYESWLKQTYMDQYYTNQWASFWCPTRSQKTKYRVYWIGVRDESVLTMMLLSVGTVNENS